MILYDTFIFALRAIAAAIGFMVVETVLIVCFLTAEPPKGNYGT